MDKEEFIKLLLIKLLIGIIVTTIGLLISATFICGVICGVIYYFVTNLIESYLKKKNEYGR